MELELSIKGGEGFVSTFSNGTSLCCKPVLSDDILNMVENFEKDKKFRVSSFGSSNGDQTHIVKESVDRYYQSSDSKVDIEQARYKQDCRKRALDLAHSEVSSPSYQKFIKDNEFVKEGNPQEKSVVQDTLITSLADKYYAWLTADIS